MDEGRRKTKVLIADQQPFFRQGVCAYVNQMDDVEICGEASSGQELLSTLNTLCPDLVLLDAELSDDSSLDLARVVKQQLPSVSVILFTPQPNDEELFTAIKTRVAGYVRRDVSSEELIDIIRKAAAGQHPINDTLLSQPKVAEQVLQQFQDLSWGNGVEAFVSPLTPRETEILTYMAKGYFNKQIAAALNISEQTIKNHITSILRKLDANARTEAVVTALRQGLISLE